MRMGWLTGLEMASLPCDLADSAKSSLPTWTCLHMAYGRRLLLRFLNVLRCKGCYDYPCNHPRSAR